MLNLKNNLKRNQKQLFLFPGWDSDWDKNNSPYDLIEDLQEIDKVIFGEKYDYNWVEKTAWIMWNYMNWVTPNWVNSFTPYKPIKITDLIWTWSIADYITPLTPPTIQNNPTNYVCSWSNNLSWLDQNFIDGIIQNPNITSSWHTNSWTNSNTHSWSFSGSLKPLITWYSKVNDNESWKCDWFFCIVIEFKMYNHKLLWWWSTISIKSIIDKSNQHLSKFAWKTSLCQYVASTNNWELSCKKFDFSKIFSMNFIIIKKSPPILNIDKKETQTEKIDKNSPLWYENLLVEYYKNLWLDYKRANSVEYIENHIQDLMSVQHSANLKATDAEDKYNAYVDYINKQQENNKNLSKVVETKIGHDDLEVFYRMFVELRVFADAMQSATSKLETACKKLNEKPTK